MVITRLKLLASESLPRGLGADHNAGALPIQLRSQR
jgi:hypothetical protein